MIGRIAEGYEAGGDGAIACGLYLTEGNVRALIDTPPAVSDDVAALVEALGAEYTLDHPLETSEERMGRHSAVRGVAARMGCYLELEAAIDAALAKLKGGAA